MKKILAPHKEQAGWLYLRSRRGGEKVAGSPLVVVDGCDIEYNDDQSGSRVISSVRVEEAVETADYLKRCAAEGLTAWMIGARDDSSWAVAAGGRGMHTGYGTSVFIQYFNRVAGQAPTLREAYHRYHAKG